MIPGVPSAEPRRNWGSQCDSLLYRVLAVFEQRNIQNAEFGEERFGKNHVRLIRSYQSHIAGKMSIVFGMDRSTKYIV